MLSILTLVENTCPPGAKLETENGLSVLIEYGGRRILFDCGQGGKFLENARSLGADPRADLVILSHGHYDHVDGFPDYLAEYGDFDLYLGENFFQDRWAAEPGGLRYLGPRFTPTLLEDRKDLRVHTVTEDVTELLPGAWLVKGFPRLCPLERPPERLRLRFPDGSLGPDAFEDEVCLVFETSLGLVVILGCAHPGIVNMLSAVAGRFPGRRIHAVLGGAHFRDASKAQIENALRYLYDLGVELLGLCHCTGDLTHWADPERIRYARFQTGTAWSFD